MAEKDISLYDLLNLSISSPGQGAVNFRAMYALLNSILRQLDLREVTVSAEDFTPGESGAEAGREEEQSRGVSAGPREQEETEAGKEAASGQENVEDAQKALDLICRTQKQTEQLLQTVKVLRHQQDKSAAAQAQSDTHLRSQRERMDALEEAMRRPQQDDCYVTWEEMKSALLTERQNLEQGLIQTLKEESVRPPSASDTAPTSDSQTEEATDVPPLPNVPVSTEASALAPAPDTAPDRDPAPVPPLQSLSQKACGASMYQETMEALWNVGRLKQRCDWMEERLAALDVEREREKEELQRLRDLIQRRDADRAFSALKKELEDQRVLLQSLMSDGDQSALLMSSVQKAILQLQNECEKLSETTQCLHEDNQQKQTHIQELYKATKQLEEKKADRNMVEVEMRADKSALETKVSRVQFDSVTEQLSNMFHELLSKVSDQEQDVSKVMDKLSHEMDLKLNRMELESVKKQLEARWKNIQEQMKSEGGLEQDDAAVFRKQLVERFHCLSCDRPVLKQSPGPQLMTLPASPSLPPHRSLRPFTVYTLEQIRQHYKSDRGAEAVDYSLYSVSRSCGGSHTVTPFTQRHRNAIQPPSQQRAPQDPLGLSEEVDIVGLDGHIYKGRLNTSPNRDKDTKLPTITSRDGSCGSSGRPPSSRAPRAVSPGLRRPSPPSGSGSLARGWSVSPLGCVSQGSTVPD